MSTFRVANPLLRQASGVLSRSAVAPIRPAIVAAPRRFLNTDTAPILYTAKAAATGGRNGHVEGSEGLTVNLGMPKSLGGAGSPGKTNPEELFAAGYGACFQGAMGLVAPKLGIKLPSKSDDSIIETTVHLVGDLKKGDLGIRVDMHVKVKGVKKEDLEKLVATAKQVCPYSRATEGNVTTTITVESF